MARARELWDRHERVEFVPRSHGPLPARLESIGVVELDRPAPRQRRQIGLVQDPRTEVLPVVRIDQIEVISWLQDPSHSCEEAHQLAFVVVLELVGEADPRVRVPLIRALVGRRASHVVGPLSRPKS